MTSVVTNAVQTDPDNPVLIEDADITRVDGVTAPASGRSFVIAKSDDTDTNSSGPSLDTTGEGSEENALIDTGASDGGDGGDVAGAMSDDSKKPYGDVQYADPGYQADKKKRYPLDTAEHIRAAWSYINQGDNSKVYSTAELARIKGRIKAAMGKIGAKVDDTAQTTAKDIGDPTDTTGDAGAGATEDPAAVDSAVPGSPGWEAADASLLAQAAGMLVEVRDMLTVASQREAVEGVVGAEDEAWSGSTSNLLYCALEELSDVLGKVAAGAALEAGEASDTVAKALGLMAIARAKVAKADNGNSAIHDGMQALARNCGCDSCTDYLEGDTPMADSTDSTVVDSAITGQPDDDVAGAKVTVEHGVAKADEGDGPSDLTEEGTPDGGTAPSAKAADDTNSTVADAHATTASGDDELSDGSASSVAKSLDTIAEAVAAINDPHAQEVVAKALLADLLGATPTTDVVVSTEEPLAKSIGTLLERTEALPRLEERVASLESQPMPGGPRLRGTATLPGQLLVLPRGGGEEAALPTDPTAVAKALEGMDPTQAEEFRRRLAEAAHPLHQ